MHLILDDYGVQLQKADEQFCIKQGEQERSISPAKITAIHIYKTAQVGAAALLMAAEHDIPVLLYDGHFKPAVRIWNSNFTSTGQVRVMQPLFCKSSAGMWWCKHLAGLKMDGQLQNLAFFANRYSAVKDKLQPGLAVIEKIKMQVGAMEVKREYIETLRGYEGAATAAYWAVFDDLLGDAVFTKRIQRDPKEPFNACVNYLYGMLYGRVEGALLSYGLDPMVGLMHTEGYNKKSLVYDCIEPFRFWAERLLVTLFRNAALQSEHFNYEADKMTLEKEGRKLLVTAFNGFLLEKTLMNNRRITRNDQVAALCSSLAQAVKNHNPVKP